MPFDIETCARPNILALHPYRCARDDYKDDGHNVLLDANENAYGPALALDKNGRLANGDLHGAANGHKAEENTLDIDLARLNRYPDPHQQELKDLLCRLRNTHTHTSRTLSPENLFVGVGSDEAIDALLRCFCRPGIDRIITCPPTYGMYAVSAQVNDVAIETVPLDAENHFALQPELINEKLSGPNGDKIKLVYICSPGNPTATLVEKEKVQKILEHPTWNGVVVIDEAYIDFADDGASLAEWVTEWPNLVVMQTLSKAFGLAGIRLGTAFTSLQVARLLNNLKAPYNVSVITSELACRALTKENLDVMRNNKAKILEQRDRLVKELPRIKGIGNIRGGLEANFILVEILDQPGDHGKRCSETALKVYESLAERKGVVVRFRGKEHGCTGCLRITVGTEREVDRFLEELKTVLDDVYSGSAQAVTSIEEQKEKDANAVIA